MSTRFRASFLLQLLQAGLALPGLCQSLDTAAAAAAATAAPSGYFRKRFLSAFPNQKLASIDVNWAKSNSRLKKGCKPDLLSPLKLLAFISVTLCYSYSPIPLDVPSDSFPGSFLSSVLQM